VNISILARSDFRNIRRSRLLQTTVGILIAAFALVVLTQSVSDGQREQAALLAVGKLFGFTALLLPVVVVPLGALSITSERTSGSIKYLLALPNTRRSVFLSKVLSRSVLAVVGMLSASLVAGLLLLVKFGTVPTPEFPIFVGLMTYYGLVWTVASVAVSALSNSRSRALSGTLGLYFLFGVVWNFLPSFNSTMVTRFVVEELLNQPAAPNLYTVVELLSPTFAYVSASQAYVFDVDLFGTGGSTPAFFEPWVTLVLMTAWAVAVLAVGYVGFQRARIG
jgi:ABC-2 type transport system permease protein